MLFLTTVLKTMTQELLRESWSLLQGVALGKVSWILRGKRDF